MDISTFIAKWKDSGASERANKDSFLNDLCDALGVARPDPKTGDSDRDRYVFERDAVLVHGGERHSIGWIDLYKHGCFILEAKQGSEAESKKIGTARRGTPAWNVAMQEAFGQALAYANTTEPPPPFIIVTDIGYCFDLYAAFDGTRNYRKFPDAINSRINIAALESDPAHIATLRAIFEEPRSLDPSKRAAKVTREIASHIAKLARSLEESGHDPERVAKFLMRCLFTMFAEDVDLLPKGIFAGALTRWIEHPDGFTGGIEDLWRKMNEGGFVFGIDQKIWQFNGGLFADPTALPLDGDQLWTLAYAAQQDWSQVEPAIFGTLLERALDPKERHRLGAHYTPRAYVERLVRPTIEEPLRAEWDNVRAQVQKLIASEDPDRNIKAVAEARKIVYAFYDRLTRIRVLDPACGSGNFLFVALDLFKRIENEVLDLLANLGDTRPMYSPSGRTVTPEQFHGIEIKEWAKWITELVLWIGYLQWQIRTRGWKSHPQEPILRDYHNIECRDAVLAYDAKEPLLDDEGQPVTRWDGETTKTSPVTGEQIPDKLALAPVYRYVNPRKAEWPEAEFVVGNPPFIGGWRMRQSLGDGYVEALWNTYSDVPEKADYVMYWWRNAAELVRQGRIRRFGLITTNSVTHAFQRRVIATHLSLGGSIAWAIPDHPWVDTASGAAVRIAMTVGVAEAAQGILARVAAETNGVDGAQAVILEELRGTIHADLRIGANVTAAAPLRANAGVASPGIQLYGDGFLVSGAEVDELEADAPIRPYLNGRDMMGDSRQASVIDTFALAEQDLRQRWPRTYQRLVLTVKPQRELNRRRPIRELWWRHGWERPALRAGLETLERYIATPETAKHRVFTFLVSSCLPDNMITAILTPDAAVLGILSSRGHVVWALAGGATLEDRPRYTKTRCFDPFPFPDPPVPLKQRIRELGEQLDAHRKRQQELHPDLTITGMYNVLEKLRSGEPLTAKEKQIHEDGLVSVLKQIHDDLDAAVFEAYGWPATLSDGEILERLVALNAERAEEERRGIVRWLRPELQNPAGTSASVQTEMAIAGSAAEPAQQKKATWPRELPKQIAALRDLVATNGGAQKVWSVEEAAAELKGSRKKEVESILDSLAALGLLIAFETSEGKRWRAAVYANA